MRVIGSAAPRFGERSDFDSTKIGRAPGRRLLSYAMNHIGSSQEKGRASDRWSRPVQAAQVIGLHELELVVGFDHGSSTGLVQDK